jgi:thiosulfate sulfurtransferase
MMNSFQHISVQELKTLMHHQEKMHVLDIRDQQSFLQGHIKQSFHLVDETFQDFVNQAEFEDTLVIVCYRGISSQRVAQHLKDLGFDTVYSLDGGYQAWALEAETSKE